MYPNTVTTSAGVYYDEGLRRFMLGVFNNMGLGLALSAVVAYFVGTSPALMSLFFAGPQKWAVIFAPLAVVFFISFRISNMSPQTARAWFFGFAALMGLSLATVFAVFKMGSIANAFFGAAVMFGAMSLWGYTTKRDLTRMGSFLMMGVIGVFAASLLNLFLQSAMLTFVVSAVAVIVFTLLTAFDVQNLKNIYDEIDGDERERAGVIGALSLYINFINIFTSLLNLFGEKNE